MKTKTVEEQRAFALDAARGNAAMGLDQNDVASYFDNLRTMFWEYNITDQGVIEEAEDLFWCLLPDNCHPKKQS